MKTTGLTLAEALRSGRFFRRVGDSLWVKAVRTNHLAWATDEVLAEDWEIQPPPPKQTWTREEVEGIKKVLESYYTSSRHFLENTFSEAGL